MSMVISGDNGLTFPAGSTQVQAGNFQTMVNRIINGRMEIDQRNAGASVTIGAGTAYTLDRWQAFGEQASKFSVQQSSTAPVGFTNSLLVTSLSAYTLGTDERFFVRHKIEGFNVADLNWGSANAKTVTLSFWVRSSLTGTFGGSLQNGAGDRSYPFTYTISSANTYEYKTITVAGDTSGTWLTTNGIGLVVNYGLGVQGSTYAGTAGAWNGNNNYSATGAVSVVSTNGATFYITGVDLRVGSYTVVPQDFRAYGTELALCQRYCEAYYQDASTTSPISWQYVAGGMYFIWQYKTEKRAQATVTKINGTWTGSTPTISGGISTAQFSSGSTFYLASTAGTLNLLATAEL